MKRLFLFLMLFAGSFQGVFAQPVLEWGTPSKNSSGAMPLGNGRLAASVWTTQDGVISLYVARVDALSEIGRILKLGRVDLRAVGGAVADVPFSQKLITERGEVVITNANGVFRVFADCNSPIIYIEGRSHKGQRIEMEVINNIWRTAPYTIAAGPEMHSIWSMQSAPAELYSLTESADTISNLSSAIASYHRNTTSVYPFTLDFQQIELPESERDDPFMDRTFGLYIAGQGFIKSSPTMLRSEKPVKDFTLKIVAESGQYPSSKAWQDASAATYASSASGAKAAQRTANYWHEFWSRSHLIVTTPDVKIGEQITQSYALQRFVTAAAGQGKYPIKFNGSLFTVDPDHTSTDYTRVSPDFRRWGESYWWQNTRLPYYPMLRTGDHQMMLPLFEHYWRNMPIFKRLAQDHYNASGAAIPETSTVFGTFGNRDYGWDRTGRERGYVNNTYIKNMWNPSLELLSMMLDYWEYTGDREFVRQRLIPMAHQFLLYFDTRFARNDKGQLQVTPTQSLETYWSGVVNDLPVVAGLHACLPRLAALPAELATDDDRALWERLSMAMPPLPRTENGELAPAQKYNKQRNNVENPELYAIFPFHLIHVGSDPQELALAIKSYNKRIERSQGGWQQNGQQAAILGLTDVAREDLLSKIANSHPNHRFPATWGPNYDWTPDQDHGGNLMTTLQDMVVQSYDGKVYLLPAFPDDWGVDFKLSVPRGGTISGTYGDGKWIEAPKLQGSELVIVPK